MKIGTLAYATNQGLGILAKSLYDNGVITDVFIIHHSSRPTQTGWYPNTPSHNQCHIREVSHNRAVRAFCESMDVMFFLETPFDWGLLRVCKQASVKTVLMPMYECMPRVLPEQPDRFINPSLLDQQYYPDRSVFLPVPSPQKWRARYKAEVFVHNAGHGGLRGRNGTYELIEAWTKHVKSPAKLILRMQNGTQLSRNGASHLTCMADNRIDWREGTFPHEKLFDDGDVFIFPEKFNGLSLPLQEAYAAGMLVMGLDRFPMNTWLPPHPLIPVNEYKENQCVSSRCLEFKEAVADPVLIARTVDEWYGRDIEGFSHLGRKWAEENSWDVLRPKYLEELAK